MKNDNIRKRRIKMVQIIWHEWVASYGAITLAVLLSIVCSHLFVGIIVLIIAHILRIFANSYNIVTPGERLCIASITSAALFTAAIIMIAISIIMRTDIIALFYDPASFNPDIPYVSALIVFPIVFVYALIGRIRIKRTDTDIDPYINKYAFAENKYRLKNLLWLSGGMSVVGWSYYYVFYINVNFNSPDTFFYYFVPFALFAMSVVYLGLRYRTDMYTICKNRSAGKDDKAVLRCIVLYDDRIFLCRNDFGQMDTPYQTALPRARYDEAGAEASVKTLVGMPQLSLRLLYAQPDEEYLSTYYHFIVQTSTGDLPDARGEWYTIEQINKMTRERSLAPTLSAEIYRVYTIAMASKTYDLKGRRLHPVKNYTPTFRLRDIFHRDVDYGDSRWLNVAKYNQDRPLWRLRRLFGRHSSDKYADLS